MDVARRDVMRLVPLAALLPLLKGDPAVSAEGAWTNQLVDLIILAAQSAGFSGFFAYNPAPGAGNLIASNAAVAAVDPYGNHYLTGASSYNNAAGIASSITAGGVAFFTGSLAAGWGANVAVINYNPALSELFVGAGQVEFNASLVHADGAVQVDGNLTVNGGTVSIPNATSISAPLATAINFDTATIDLVNGNVNLNMARPPNYAAVVAGTATAAQVEACLGGLLTSLTNRKLMA